MSKLDKRNSLPVFPYVKEIEYSSKIDSFELNKMLSSLEESSMRALIRGRSISSEYNKLFLGVIKSYQSLEYKVNSTSYSMNPPNIDSGVANNFAVASVYNSNFSNNTSGVYYDIPYGFSTLKQISSFSKIPRGNGYNGRISPQVDIYLNDEKIEYDTEIYDALDGTNKSFWIKEVSVDSENVLKINLPPSITKRLNYIEVFPFPIYGMKITKIEYENLGGRKEDVTTNIYGINPLIDNNGESIKLFLSPKEFNGTIYITIIANQGVIGFSNIDVKFIDYDNTTSYGYLKFDTLNNFISYGSVINTINIKNLLLDFYMDGSRIDTLINNSDDSPIKAWLKVGKYNSLTGTIDDTSTPTVGYINQLEIKLNGNFVMNINKNILIPEGESLWLIYRLIEHNVTTPVIRGAKVLFDVTIGG